MIVFLFIGFPPAYDKVFAIITGVVVLVIGLKERNHHRLVQSNSTPYVEHRQSMTDVRSSDQITNTNSEQSS